jgi:hypothetical protein
VVKVIHQSNWITLFALLLVNFYIGTLDIPRYCLIASPTHTTQCGKIFFANPLEFLLSINNKCCLMLPFFGGVLFMCFVQIERLYGFFGIDLKIIPPSLLFLHPFTLQPVIVLIWRTAMNVTMTYILIK